MKFLIIVSYDSYIKPATFFAESLKEFGHIVDIRHISFGDRNALSKSQIWPLENIATIDESNYAELAKNYDAVFIGAGGKDCHRLIKQTRLHTNCLSISFFPGICWHGRDKSFLLRSAADIILFNNEADIEYYKLLGKKYIFQTNNFVNFGLPYGLSNTAQQICKTMKEVQNVIFFEQEVVPDKKVEKQKLLNLLITFANTYTDKNIYIKPRTFENETSPHTGDIRLADIADAGQIPTNLKITYKATVQLLETADLALSISSTALLEAANRNIAFCAVSDFGIKDEYHLSFFKESGAITNFEALMEENYNFNINHDWLAKNRLATDEDISLLLQKISHDELAQNNNDDLPYQKFITKKYLQKANPVVRILKKFLKH